MSPEKYITWSDLPNYDDYGDEQYWWGNYDSNGDYVELSIGIDWNDPHPFFGVWVDGMLMTDVEVFDMERAEEYRQKALEQLSIIVFEKENNVKFPRDYWGRPILGKKRERVARPQHVAQERTVDSETWWQWFDDARNDIDGLVGHYFGKPVEIFADVDNYGTNEARVDVKVSASTNSMSEMDLDDLRDVLRAAVRAIDYAKDLSGWIVID